MPCFHHYIIVVKFSLICFGAELLRAAVSQRASRVLKLGIVFKPGLFLHRG